MRGGGVPLPLALCPCVGQEGDAESSATGKVLLAPGLLGGKAE